MSLVNERYGRKEIEKFLFVFSKKIKVKKRNKKEHSRDTLYWNIRWQINSAFLNNLFHTIYENIVRNHYKESTTLIPNMSYFRLVCGCLNLTDPKIIFQLACKASNCLLWGPCINLKIVQSFVLIHKYRNNTTRWFSGIKHFIALLQLTTVHLPMPSYSSSFNQSYEWAVFSFKTEQASK